DNGARLCWGSDVGRERSAGASYVVPKKVKANFRPLESKNLCDGVDLTIPIKVIEKGHKSFVRFLIEVRAYATLKDSVIMGIPFPDVVSNIDKMNNDGFQTMVNKRKSGKTCSTINNRSGAAADNPFKKLPAKKGGPHIPSCKPSVPTFNPYDVLDDMDSEEEAKVF
nr:hypothetical protein [Tanacetum cinerariifolium]